MAKRLREVRIDPRSWDDAERGRKDEWALAITELLGEPELRFADGAHRLEISLTSQATHITLLDKDGNELGAVDIPRSTLADHVTEYVDIVRQIDSTSEGSGSSRLEALDMAKKLAHDAAAKTLRRSLRPLGPNHATCRRLWTLLLSLRVDTTRLTGIRGHRPVRR